MKRFSGMVFDTLRAGSYNLPMHEYQLPNGNTAALNLAMATTDSLQQSMRLCFGLFSLEELPLTNDGEFEVHTLIQQEERTYGEFKCEFNIIDGIVTNYTWTNVGDPSVPFVIRSINFTSNSKCFPIVFAIEDSDEFNKSFVIDESNCEILQAYGIPAKWVRSSEYVTIKFCVDENGNNEFNMPINKTVFRNSNLTLPTFDSLFYKNYAPISWRIENIDYPLGGTYTVPTHDVMAELIYDSKNYSGYIF